MCNACLLFLGNDVNTALSNGVVHNWDFKSFQHDETGSLGGLYIPSGVYSLLRNPVPFPKLHNQVPLPELNNPVPFPKLQHHTPLPKLNNQVPSPS